MNKGAATGLVHATLRGEVERNSQFAFICNHLILCSISHCFRIYGSISFPSGLVDELHKKLPTKRLHLTSTRFCDDIGLRTWQHQGSSARREPQAKDGDEENSWMLTLWKAKLIIRIPQDLPVICTPSCQRFQCKKFKPQLGGALGHRSAYG